MAVTIPSSLPWSLKNTRWVGVHHRNLAGRTTQLLTQGRVIGGSESESACKQMPRHYQNQDFLTATDTCKYISYLLMFDKLHTSKNRCFTYIFNNGFDIRLVPLPCLKVAGGWLGGAGVMMSA